MQPQAPAAFDCIVVGSGAGGGPVAANLAEAGYRTLLLEAGTDHEDYNYQVPSFRQPGGHTKNQAGSVKLRSADPRDPPQINFHYFEEGSDAAGDDLDSVVAGVEFVRSVAERASDDILADAKRSPAARPAPARG